jgi:two-component system NarL family response regulator
MTPTEKINSIRILIADDHPIVCEGLAMLLNRRPDMTVVAEAHTGREAVELFHQLKPDLALIDLRMPEMDGVTAIRTIRAQDSDARIIVLTTYDGDEDIYRALHAGAQAYLIKDTPRNELLACIRSVYRGEQSLSSTVVSKLSERQPGADLTPREFQVLQLVGEGKSNKEIGATLSIAEGTVKLHVNNLFAKLEAGNRAEAVAIALKRGILHVE